MAQPDHDRLQIFALLGQVVLVIAGALGLAAFHQPRLDQMVQPRGENVPRDTQAALEIGEAGDATIERVSDDQQAPALSD